jgi:hypothetical protein
VIYSQVLITGRMISGKSRYPDIFEFGYQIIMATLFCPILTYDPISGPDIGS